MTYEKPHVIKEIDFHDIKVKVYHHPELIKTPNNFQTSFQMRNPDTCYTGMIHMDNEGKTTYPEGAVIPEQTDRDREMLPNFVIVGKLELNDEDTEIVINRLESEYQRRNKPNDK